MSELERREDAPDAALKSMIDEVRADEPNVDWARIEARLFDERGEVRAPAALSQNRTAPNRTAAIASGLALAAAFAIALVSPTRAVDDNAGNKVSVTRPALMLDEGRQVSPGDRVFGGAWLKSSGRIAIRLEPGAVATVLDVGERVHLSLQSGAVTAEVTPVAGGEPFAIDVAGKRVAVHGTRLRIALVNGEVEVAVSEGSAVVGEPRGKGRTEGTIVAAGHVGHFGSTSNVVANKPLATQLVEDVLSPATPTATVINMPPAIAPAPTTTNIASSPPMAKSTVTQPAKAAELPVEPAAKLGLSAEQLSAPLSSLTAKIGHCAPSVFENTLTLQISPSGVAELVGEDPGLDSPMRNCVRTELAKITFPTAEAATTVRRFVKFTGK